MRPTIEFLSAILIVSRKPKELADFYRDVLGIPLDDEVHDETAPHYGCELGDIHFAIHPVENFPDKQCGVGAVKMAFTIFDIESFVQSVKQKGTELIYGPEDRGFAIMAALKDPDGNYLEFTQLSESWFSHLESRKQSGMDVVTRWKEVSRL